MTLKFEKERERNGKSYRKKDQVSQKNELL